MIRITRTNRTTQPNRRSPVSAAREIMCGFYYHFNNLRFNKSQNINDSSAAHAVISFASSEHLKCRLLKWLLDHPTESVSTEIGRSFVRGCDERLPQLLLLSLLLSLPLYVYIYIYICYCYYYYHYYYYYYYYYYYMCYYCYYYYYYYY